MQRMTVQKLNPANSRICQALVQPIPNGAWIDCSRPAVVKVTLNSFKQEFACQTHYEERHIAQLYTETFGDDPAAQVEPDRAQNNSEGD